MGGFFGIVSREDCVLDLFYGTDYHSHLGTQRGGLATWGTDGLTRFIHDIRTTQFRSKFENDIARMSGNNGIGVISDFDDQPLIINSHLGIYAIVTVGAIRNSAELARGIFKKNSTHFSEMCQGEINPTELMAALINQEKTFEDGIRSAQEQIEGSCSLLILTKDGIYAARDRLGRTPVALGRKTGAWAATMETCALPNLDFETDRHLGPGEIVLIHRDGVMQIKPPEDRMRICAFLWVYYGYPASDYENINVEACRYRCGACLFRRETSAADTVCGIPDSGTGHAMGYSQASGVPFKRSFVKYTPTWPRSFMPQDQDQREKIARMKLIPIRELIANSRLLFCEDSIVRGMQLRNTIYRLFEAGAREVHMRPACPPLMFACKYLNFSRTKSEDDLAARRAVREIEGPSYGNLEEYTHAGTDRYERMVDIIRKQLGLTTLRYQRLDDLIEAIGMPADKVCTYCWSGRE